MNYEELIKIRLTFDGWRYLSKKQTQEILKEARKIFVNANFISNSGLIIEDTDEMRIFSFCLNIIKFFKNSFRNWDGYEIKRLSKKILFNYSDRKRKLKFDYFKKLVIENDLSDIKLVLAWILYLEPEEVKDCIFSIEKDFCHSFKDMTDDEISDAYRILLMYASSKDRKFSLNKI